jgi:phage gp36-like protein
MGPGDTPYVTAAELTQYAPAAVLNLAPSGVQDQACIDATQEADSYMRGRYQLPLLAWGSDVKKYTAWIACYLIAQQVGFAPQAGSDRLIVERYYAAVGWPDRAGTGWFPGIQRQAIHPDVTPTLASPGNPTYDLPQVRTAPQRGWQQTVNGKPVI